MDSEPPMDSREDSEQEDSPKGAGEAQEAQEPPEPAGEDDASDESERGVLLDDVDVRDLLRRALDDGRTASREIEITRGVQRRLREQTRGRFFADRWSTSNSPRGVYLVTTVLMLLVIALAYMLLMPM
ncbi:MAG: hypothetical protein VB934_09455, partial [Polyangiaceae bacterium]